MYVPMPSDSYTLADLGLFTGDREQVYETTVDLVLASLNVPIALISVIDQNLPRQFFKAHRGLPEFYASKNETPISLSVCETVKETNDNLVIQDMRLDIMFADHPSISELGVHAYLGSPIHGPVNDPIGALCAIDHVPRTWKQADLDLLTGLALIVSRQILLHASLKTINLITKTKH